MKSNMDLETKYYIGLVLNIGDNTDRYWYFHWGGNGFGTS